MKKNIILISLLTVLISVSQAAFSESADSIVNKADAAFTGERVYSESTMTVYRNGQARPAQSMEGYSMDKGGKTHSLTIYRSPARMKGTAYLMIGDDLWVRFSTTGRVRKMSSSAKKNSAGGSDFSYADMGDGSSGIAEKYEAEFAGETSVDGEACYMVQLNPAAGADALYEKILAYITKNTYRYLKIEYFDAGAKIKTMKLDDYREAGGTYYPFFIEMQSEVKNTRTVIETSAMEFGSSKVNDRLFTVSYLETLR